MLSKEQIHHTITALTELKQNETALLEKIAMLEDKMLQLEKAEALTLTLLERGYFPTESFSEKLAQYKETPLSDLMILEKAAELAESNPAIFGSLSVQSAPDYENPLLACLFDS